MDQLKQVGEFIWKWRFWFALGIVVILAGVVQPVGTAKVQAMIQRRKAELDSALSQIQPYTMGDQHPIPSGPRKSKPKKSPPKPKSARFKKASSTSRLAA